MTNDIKIINNETALHFETLLSNGEYAFIEYRWSNGNLVLMHTFVPEGFEGKGIAAALAKFALEYAKDKQLKVVVYCPYVNVYLKKHPEYQAIVIKNYTP